MARRLLKEEGAACLDRLTDETYEELQLQGLIIGAVREEAGEKLERIRKFVDKIDNWAVCDAFCGGLTFTRKNQRQVLDFLKPYVSSEREFEARFAAVMLLSWYVDEAHISETLRLLDQIRQPDYYASMAVALGGFCVLCEVSSGYHGISGQMEHSGKGYVPQGSSEDSGIQPGGSGPEAGRSAG